MLYSRSTAVIFVFLLIAILAAVSIEATLKVGSALMHGNTVNSGGLVNAVQHSHGFIESIDANKDFLFKTEDGQVQKFECGDKCLTALSHMGRHINEHAATDVYYVHQSNNTLEAIDVD